MSVTAIAEPAETAMAPSDAGFFLSLTDAIGESGTFYLFAAMCVAAFVSIWFEQTETKGRTLAEIQEMWERRAGVVGGGS